MLAGSYRIRTYNLSAISKRIESLMSFVELKHAFVLILCFVSSIAFIRGTIIPFLMGVDPPIEIYLHIISLVFIFTAFVFVVKTGSFLTGSIMTIIGGFYVFYGFSAMKFWLELSKPETMSNLTGYNDFAVGVIILGLIVLGLGFHSITRRFTKNQRIQKRSAV